MQTSNQHVKIRDNQRQRCYNAEGEWRAGFDGFEPFTEETNPRFESLEDIARFYGRVLKAKRVLKRWPFLLGVKVPQIKPGCSGATAYGYWKVTFDIRSRNLKSALHELAHVIHDFGSDYNLTRQHGMRPPTKAEDPRWWEGHGYQFCRIYLELVLLYMGREKMRGLKAAFKKHRVRYKAPRKMSPEQRAAAVARLAAVRPVREPKPEWPWGAFCPVPALINRAA